MIISFYPFFYILKSHFWKKNCLEKITLDKSAMQAIGEKKFFKRKKKFFFILRTWKYVENVRE